MTRRAVVRKWILYCLCALLLVLVQNMVLVYVRIGGVHPFLLPALALIPVTLERSGPSLLYALFFGLACDLLIPSGVFVCFYCLTFFIAAILARLLSGQVIAAGLFCSLTVSAVGLLLCGFFADHAADVPARRLHRPGADAAGQGAAAVVGGDAAGAFSLPQGLPADAERLTMRSFP